MFLALVDLRDDQAECPAEGEFVLQVDVFPRGYDVGLREHVELGVVVCGKPVEQRADSEDGPGCQRRIGAAVRWDVLVVVQLDVSGRIAVDQQ